jgi:pimeloyl-ACP methyl ester carboxylesterase/DNA-binding CsgD family transcriptional regulator
VDSIFHPPEIVETLTLHLERATRNNDYIHILEDQRHTLNTIYNNMPWPLLMVDEHMIVMDANDAARQLLHAQSLIEIAANGALYFRDAKLKAALKRVLTMEGGRDTQILNSTSGNLSLLCIPLAKSDASDAMSRLRAVIWVISNDNKIIPSTEIIQAIFGLTLAEARLLNLLCREGSLNECAKQLEVSIHTVRSQLKSIMSKTNTSSQVKLVSQAMGHSFLQKAAKNTLMLSGEEQRLVLPDGRILSWFEYGSPQGRPVLSLEGLGGALPYHNGYDSWYKENNLRVINIIRPGYGLSTLKPELQFVDFADDIVFLCQHLNCRKPVMAAYCCGGTYALCAAAKYPGIFERMGILGTTVAIEYWELHKLDFMHSLFLRMHRVSPKIFSMFMRLAIRGMQRDPEKSSSNIARHFRGRDAEILNDPAVKRRSIEQQKERRYQGTEIIIREYQLLQSPWMIDFGDIKIPTLIWHGEDDPTISVDSVRAMAAAIPGAIFKSIPKQGRFLVHDVWLDFLAELLKDS